jgi:deazaflavin-dependent oxidoreductase (nitroreductase family)
MTRIARIRPFTNLVINPITRRFAGWMPGFAILSYVGRRSGKRYRTPINVFHHEGRFVFALTYGREAQWVKNVLAAGTCEIEERGRTIRLAQPELIVDPTGRLVPAPVGLLLGLQDVTEYLLMTPVSAPDPTAGP